ncbi:uncharacterized protein LOC142177252 [Nicotiana tabacum]|uniref:Uncharacterized protein LOC142177252 n=1 Tax=Nicotiana tabacum TaxID=4097 RepID=A0AC58TXC3_TOBAC
MDIVGPLPLGPEKGPYQKIDEREVVDFIWDHIICRFRILKKIACDSRPQFVGSKVAKFLEGLKIKRTTSSPYHPSANVQAESTNKRLGNPLGLGVYPKVYRFWHEALFF